jgi:hypothetical protein
MDSDADHSLASLVSIGLTLVEQTRTPDVGFADLLHLSTVGQPIEGAELAPQLSQSQGVPNDAAREERHGGSGNDPRQENSKKWIERAGSDGDPGGVVE